MVLKTTVSEFNINGSSLTPRRRLWMGLGRLPRYSAEQPTSDTNCYRLLGQFILETNYGVHMLSRQTLLNCICSRLSCRHRSTSCPPQSTLSPALLLAMVIQTLPGKTKASSSCIPVPWLLPSVVLSPSFGGCDVCETVCKATIDKTKEVTKVQNNF